MQPDPNQHPRFRWKPDDDALSSSSLPPRQNESSGRAPEKSKITSLRVNKRNFDVSEIRSDKLGLNEISGILEALGMPIPVELLQHLAAVVERGGPLDLRVLQSCSGALEEISLKHLKDYLIKGADLSTQWVYLIKKNIDEEDDETDVLSPPADKDMLIRVYRGPKKGIPQIVIDWQGVIFDANNPIAKRWEAVERVLDVIDPALEIGRMPNLTEFVDDDKTKGECGLVLRFRKADVVVLEGEPDEAEEKNPGRGEEDNPAPDGAAGEGPDLRERFAEEDWSEDTEEDQGKVLLERPARGDTVIVQHLTPRKLEVLSRLAGFPLRKNFFAAIMDTMEHDREPGESVLPPLKEIGREISFSKETLYVSEDGCGSKWSDVLIADETGPFGRFLINLSHVCAGNSERRVLAAKLKFYGTSDEIKKLPWEKILKAAGY